MSSASNPGPNAASNSGPSRGPGRRELLFLQGLPGTFFADLGAALAARGHGVHKIHFNGGDWVSWPQRGAVAYAGGAARWPTFLARLLVERGITDVVLFGDCRPMHRTAHATALGLGVAVHVFEEGYLRPDWITLERGGVNGFSPMPSDPDWYERTAATIDEPPGRPGLASSFNARARASVAYYAAALALAWAFPFHRTHRPWNPIVEAAGWAVRLARRGLVERRSQDERARLDVQPYFVLPLQLNSDSQLRAHSDFDGMQAALAHAIGSFARHAPAETCLVVKQHPLDNGLYDWRGQVRAFARAVGALDRVVFLEVGDIDPLVREARGVVTVNSTTGTLALAGGVPVIALGRAVYAIAGLTHQGTLESFWTRPQSPDVALYEAFRRVLAHRCLLWGGFYDATSRTTLVEAAAGRILAIEVDAVAEPALRARRGSRDRQAEGRGLGWSRPRAFEAPRAPQPTSHPSAS